MAEGKGGMRKGDIEKFKKRNRTFTQRIFTNSKKAFQHQGQWWFGKMADQFRAPLVDYGHVNTNTTLHSRSKGLANSLNWKVQGGSLKALKLRMTSNSPYARVQEFGGPIRAKRTKYLAIPIDDALFPTGKRRYVSPLQFKNDPNVRFLRTKSGKLFLVRDKFKENKGKGAAFTQSDVEFLFAFRKTVDIPGPRSGKRKMKSRLGFMDNAVGPDARKQFRRRLANAARKSIQEAQRGGA